MKRASNRGTGSTAGETQLVYSIIDFILNWKKNEAKLYVRKQLFLIWQSKAYREKAVSCSFTALGHVHLLQQVQTDLNASVLFSGKTNISQAQSPKCSTAPQCYASMADSFQTRAGVMLNCLCRCNLGNLRKEHPVGWSHSLWHFSYWLQFSETQAAVSPQAGTGVRAEPWALFAAKVLKNCHLCCSPQVPDNMCDKWYLLWTHSGEWKTIFSVTFFFPLCD